MALLLSVPRQEPVSKAARREIIDSKDWLNHLPWDNTSVCLQQILERLKKQNRCSMKPAIRWQQLEACQHPLFRLEDTIDQSLGSCRLPVFDALKIDASICAELEMEMAYGYKIILSQQSRSFLASVPIAKLTQRALYHLFLTYYRSSSQYQPIPEGLWFEIHQLFHSCPPKQQLQRSPHPRNPEKMSAIADIYLQALLTGIFNPYQQIYITTKAANAFLDEYSSSARLEEYKTPGRNRGKFVIDPLLDQPTKPRGLTDPDGENKKLWLLDTRPLISQLHLLWRERHSKKYPAIATDRFFVSQALRTWDLAPSRKNERLRKESDCDVVIGLHTCHHLLHNKSLFIPDFMLQQITSRDRDLTVCRFQFISQYLKRFESATEYQIENWHRINESPAGLCLYGTSTGLSTDPGTILAMNIDQQAWHVGIVRWVQQHQQNQMLLGIENLGPGVSPVATMLGSRHHTNDITTGLLIPQIPLLHRPLSLLVEHGLFKKGQKLLLDDGHRLYRFSCSKVLEQHHYFDWLALQIMK